MMRFVLFIAAILLSFTQLCSQTRVVYGKLTTFNQFPLSNVKVSAKKSGTSAISDSLGIFSIVCRNKDVVKIQPEAFHPVSRRVRPGTDSLFINLVFVDSEANREIAVGYGYINKNDLTYAVGSLENENNDFCDYTDIYSLLKGKIPGVQIQGDAVYIRGINSINASSKALIVLDGMIVNDISWINPCHVRSIDVIKDSMSSIYGSRGANGVVVIETRKGGE